MNNITEKLKRIKTDSLIRYLSENGWIKVYELNNGKGIQYISPSQEEAVIIPFDENFQDYAIVLIESLNTISNWANLSLESLITILLYPPADLIKYRVDNPSLPIGMLPIIPMADMINSIKNSLAATINSIINPSSYYNKLFSKETNDIFNKYSFGQTEIGSYVLNIVSLVGQYQYSFIENLEIPQTRLINEKLITSFSTIQDDLIKNNLNKIEEEVEQKIYSCNFLESMSNIYAIAKDSTVDLSVHWCESIPRPKIGNDHLTLNPKYQDRLIYIVERLKKPIEVQSKNYYGKITTINVSPDINDRKAVDIKFVTIGDNGKEIKVNATLDYETYFNEVENALKNGLNIKVAGKISTTGKSSKIEIEYLEVLD